MSEIERLHQEFIFNKFKNKCLIDRETKVELSKDCIDYKINYTDIYAKIINYQILKYGRQLSAYNYYTHDDKDKEKLRQSIYKRKVYRLKSDYLNRVSKDKLREI